MYDKEVKELRETKLKDYQIAQLAKIEDDKENMLDRYENEKKRVEALKRLPERDQLAY